MTSAHVSTDSKFAVTSSTDGGAIVWHVPEMTRAHMLRGSGALLDARLHPNNVHAVVLSCDNRVSYWDTVTGDQLRNVELVKKGRLTCMDLSQDGM